jgi:hypothetical membrane protein
MNPTRIGIVLFVLAVVAGPWYTVAGYSPVSHLISELGAQRTPNMLVMAAAFIALGAGIGVDALRHWRRPLAPFLAFGAFMVLVGIFPHKPITPGLAYSAPVHAAHAALATAAGIAITAAFAWQAWREPAPRRRVQASALAVLCLALPLAMLALPPWQGAIQRLMYTLVFVWLWARHPREVH